MNFLGKKSIKVLTILNVFFSGKSVLARVEFTVPAPSFGLFERTADKFAETPSVLASLDLEGGLEGYDASAVKVDYAFFLHAVGVEIALIAVYALDAWVDRVLDLGGVA